MESWDQALFLTVLTSPVVLKAAWTTVWVATVAQATGTAIGLLVAPMMLAKALPLRAVAFLYLWIFRGTPLLAQILFFYAVLPQLGLRLGVVATGLLALGINEGARMAEIVRAGLLSVGPEQREAAASLGLKRHQIFFLVVMPQALRAVLPAIGNNYTYMIKATSLLSVISFAELLRTSQQLAQSTARPLEVYAAATAYYITIVTVVTLLQRRLERSVAVEERQPEPARGAGFATAPRAPIRPAASARAADAKPSNQDGPMWPPLVQARGLTKRLGPTLALDGVDLEVRRGEVVMVLGPSGSGKSTLLRCLNHLDPPDSGLVTIGGEPIGVRIDVDGMHHPLPERAVDRQRIRIGMVFQRFNLFPHLSAADNVALGLRRIRRMPKAEARQRAVALLTRFGLADKVDSRPAELSGGQQQRVAIARALALEPALLLFDEPTSALDPETVGEVLAVIRSLAEEGTTMIVVTHEIGFARAIADRVVVMHGGHVVEEGSPAKVLDAPRDPRTRAFLAQGTGTASHTAVPASA
jgi:polar amino acid transport system permease protein